MEIGDIINKIGLCNDIKNKHSNYYKILADLLQFHPRKKANGMINLKIVYSVYKTLQLIVVYNNFKEDSISWVKCVQARGSKCIKVNTDIADLSKAMRNAVHYQIKYYKDKFNNSFICEICCKNGNNSNEFHADHIIDFAILQNNFFRNRDYKPNEFSWDKGVPLFLDKDIRFKCDWELYHYNNLELRILCRKCNISRQKTKVIL